MIANFCQKKSDGFRKGDLVYWRLDDEQDSWIGPLLILELNAYLGVEHFNIKVYDPKEQETFGVLKDEICSF